MNDKLQNRQLDASPRDPIEWAFIAVVLGGSSLILALEAKIEARRHAESAAAADKAKTGNILRLVEIRNHLNQIRDFVSAIPILGKIEINRDKPGISKNSIIFTSAADEESFNQLFDRVTASIGQINRLLSDIDPVGIPLADDDVRTFVTNPMRRAQDKVIPILRDDVDPHERINRVYELLQDYANLIENLGRALGSK